MRTYESFEEWPDTNVDFVHEWNVGAKRLAGIRYDLTLIGADLAGLSGIELGRLAGNEGTPVIVISGDVVLNETLASLDYPLLTKPFSLNQLLMKARQALAEGRKNIDRVTAATTQLQATIEAAKQMVETPQDYRETASPALVIKTTQALA